MSLSLISTSKCFGGLQQVYSHNSSSTHCPMKFGIYLPEGATNKETSKTFPVLFYLSGLTCTEENFIFKSGFQRYASQYGFIVVNPDTSPRGCNIEGESESWDFGVGAGFYVNATVEKWCKNFRMYSYICEELPKLIAENFAANQTKIGIMGHSMGGHGALMCALKHPTIFRSVSAFSPISNPTNCSWGQKAFKGYLGDDQSKWQSYDSCFLAERYDGPNLSILIDQGDGDKFYAEKQLLPENFVEACSKNAGKLKCSLRLHQEETAKDILNILKSTPMNLDVLQKTRIGMTVNELRKKIQSKELQSDAKGLIKTWKKLLEAKDKDKAQNGLPRTESMASNMSVDSSSNDVPDGALGSQDFDPSVMQKNFKKLENIRPSATPTKPLYDDMRKKSEDLLLKSLTYCEPPEDSLDAEQLAAEIEQAIYDLFGSTNEKYRAAIRSRVFNLRDKKNPDLRENVLLGMLKPSRLAKMTPEEMASKDMKELRKTMTKQAINDHQVSHESGTESDMFTCGKCKGKNCTYTQVQTRSADEPMTTFVYCRTCGNRWKFC